MITITAEDASKRSAIALQLQQYRREIINHICNAADQGEHLCYWVGPWDYAGSLMEQLKQVKYEVEWTGSALKISWPRK